MTVPGLIKLSKSSSPPAKAAARTMTKESPKRYRGWVKIRAITSMENRYKAAAPGCKLRKNKFSFLKLNWYGYPFINLSFFLVFTGP